MIEKHQEIDNLKDTQFELKGEISNLKSRIPKFIIGFLFATVLAIYFLESSLYHFFGNGMNFVKFSFAVFIVVSLLFLYMNSRKVLKKGKKLKIVSGKLYQLMKLNEEDAKT